MKKHLQMLAFAIMLGISCLCTRSFAAEVANVTNVAATERLKQIKLRVEEIKHMDKSNLTRDERKELRHELKDMHNETKAIGDGMYLSVGAVVIVVLVLVLML